MPGTQPENLIVEEKPEQSRPNFSWSGLDKYKSNVSRPQNVFQWLIAAGVYFFKFPAKIVHFVVDWFKVNEPRWRTTLALLLLVAIVSSAFFVNSSISQAASYTFVQTSWAGGVDAATAAHPTNQTSWNKYSAHTNADTSAGSSVKSATTTGNRDENFSTTTYLDTDNSTTSVGWGVGIVGNSHVSAAALGYHFDNGSGQSATQILDATRNGILGSTSGSESNDPTWATTGGVGATTPTGTYLSFDGGDSVYAPNTGTITANAAAMTVSYWAKFDVDGTARMIMAKGDPSPDNNWKFDRGSANYIRFCVTNTSVVEVCAQTANNVFTGSAWHHITGVYDGANVRLYVDAVQRTADVPQTGNVRNQTSENICFGGNYAPSGPNFCTNSAGAFVGGLDEIKIWTRALSGSEITTLANINSTYTGTAQSLSLPTSGASLGSFTLTAVADFPLDGTITYNVSNNGGSTWSGALTEDVAHNFASAGSDLRLRINFTNWAVSLGHSVSWSGYHGTSDLTSSAYDTGDTNNLISKLAWVDSGTSGTETVRFQMRSAPDSSGSPGTWSAWCGYDDCSGTNYFETADNNVTLASDHPLRTGGNDRWLQYKIFLASGGLATASVTSITVTYVVNAPPAFEAAPTVAQITDSLDANWGKVSIAYSIRDADTDTGTTTPGFVTPSFDYNIGGGWISIPSNRLSANALDNKAVDDVNYTTYTAYWDAQTQIPTNYLTTAQVRVNITDNEAANATATSSSANFTLDTKVPVISTFTNNNATNTANLVSTDDTNLEYRISTDQTFTGVAWTAAGGNSINVSPSTGPASQTIYVQVRDTRGNTSSATAVAPSAVTNMDIKDISNEAGDNYREFISWTPYSSVANATFSKYEVFRSTDGSSYSSYANITDINLNYYLDTAVSAGTTYYYKVQVVDTDTDRSAFSAAVSDNPNGQGGTDVTTPTITSVTVAETQATYARITWTTDELSDSRVDYSVSPSTAFGSGQTNSSFVTSHSITITGLTPETTYLFRVRSADVLGNTGTNDNAGAGFTITTTGGPVITNVTEIELNENSATIQWNTDVDSDSFVTYSTNSNLSSSTRVGSAALVGGGAPFQHRVTLTGLNPGTTYYYRVESTDAVANLSINNNGGSFFSFVTTTDEDAPVISNIATPVIAPTAAVVVWETDEPATTQLSWGTISGNLGTTTTLDSTLTIFHVVSLSGLAEGTEYFYKVKSKDSADNETISSENDFTTGATTVIVAGGGGGGGSSVVVDSTAPTISNIQTSDVGSFKATISFDTSESAIGLVQYGRDKDKYEYTASVSDYSAKQTVNLNGLQMGTDYYFLVKAIDKAGNVTTEVQKTFKTTFFTESDIELEDASQFQKEVEEAIESALPSLVPPFIERPQSIEITDNSARITWRTNIKTFSTVAYASDEDYDATKENPYQTEISDITNKVNDHSILLENLRPNTRYHFQAKSFSLPRLIGKSADLTFVTKALNIQAQITDIGNSTFRVAWRTAEPTSSVVEYRNTKTGVLNQKTLAEQSTSHEILVDGLTPATAYEVSVYGINNKGNRVQTASAVRITTSQDIAPPQIISLKIDTAIVPGRNDRTQTIVSWKTNEPSTSTVFYEEGSGSGTESKVLANKVEITNSYVMDHAVVLSVLKPGGLYRIQVASTDTAGNVATIPTKTIVVPRESESILDVVFKNFEDTFKFLRQIGN